MFKNHTELRKWLYGIILAAAPVIIVYGIASEAEVQTWVALALAVIGSGTAIGNVSDNGSDSDSASGDRR